MQLGRLKNYWDILMPNFNELFCKDKVIWIYHWNKNRSSCPQVHPCPGSPKLPSGLMWTLWASNLLVTPIMAPPFLSCWTWNNRVDNKICICVKLCQTECGHQKISESVWLYVHVKYSAGTFCFNKGLCMIWNKGTLSEDKPCLKSCYDLGFHSPNRSESDLSNEVLYILVG